MELQNEAFGKALFTLSLDLCNFVLNEFNQAFEVQGSGNKTLKNTPFCNTFSNIFLFTLNFKHASKHKAL